MSTYLSRDLTEQQLTLERLFGAGFGPDARMREPERSTWARKREADHAAYLEHDADFAEDFNRRIYAPPASEAPDDLDEYHGTSTGAIYCGCDVCQALREREQMNGWLILTHVRLGRRPSKAPELDSGPLAYIDNEPVVPAWAERLRAELGVAS